MRALLLFLATLSLSMSATSIVSADWHYDFGGPEPPEGLLIHNNPDTATTFEPSTDGFSGAARFSSLGRWRHC